MIRAIMAMFFLAVQFPAYSQAAFAKAPDKKDDLTTEVAHLKDVIRQLQANELRSEKAIYQKNYQLIVNGVEIIKEMQQGAIEITGARNQNMLYKKLMDINNPSSEALGFQLLDVITKSLEDNINTLPLVEGEKKRLKGTVANLFEGLKKTFPPLQIVSSAFSVISSFTSFTPRIEKLNRKVDSVVVDVSNPITKEIIQKIIGQLQPYIYFYTELNRTNSAFETALYQHEIQYRDFVQELDVLKMEVEKQIRLDASISGQINDLFDLANSSSVDFNYKAKLDSAPVRDIVGNCMNIIELVDRYKKFTTDFILIQEDFFKNNLQILQNIAKNLPYKDLAKIDQLIADLSQLKNGSTADGKSGFDAGYRQKLRSILTKLHAINRLRV